MAAANLASRQSLHTEEEPYNRAHRRSIDFLRPQVDATTGIPTEQIQVLCDLQSGLVSRLENDSASVIAEDERVEDRVIKQCLASVEGKLTAFQGLRSQLDDLKIWVRVSVSVRQSTYHPH